MSSKQGQVSPPSYMDGVMVKISEKYKPPPRINLPVSYSQRLLINKQVQDKMGHYDFSLERTIKERMLEWKTARAAIHEEHKERLEKIKETRKKIIVKPENENCKSENDEYLSNNTDMLIPTVATSNSSSDILKPMRLMNLNSEEYICKPVDRSPFNISDFEADTSSPFDNVELKTINDMAELALVLQKNNDKKNLNMQQYSYLTSNSFPYVNYNQRNITAGSNQQYSYPSQLPTTSASVYVQQQQPTNSSLANGYYAFQSNENLTTYVYNSNKDDENKLGFRRISDIMKALETDLNHSVDASNDKSNSSQRKNLEEKFEELEPYKSLPKNLQDLSRLISGMGFPLNRVAKICKILGDDQKKVVEHLLAMSELLDLGFSEADVSKALLKCNNDRDKALDMLIL